MVIRDGVTALLQNSSFLLATELDENVSFENPFMSTSRSRIYSRELIFFSLDQGRPSNFSHKAIIELAKQFYYSGKADSLALLFPEVFSKSLPKQCLAMVCTCVSFYYCISFGTTTDTLQIVNCLEEWESGSFRSLPFTGTRYEAVHKVMMELISKVEEDGYHGRKFRKLLKAIATSGL